MAGSPRGKTQIAVPLAVNITHFSNRRNEFRTRHFTPKLLGSLRDEDGSTVTCIVAMPPYNRMHMPEDRAKVEIHALLELRFTLGVKPRDGHLLPANTIGVTVPLVILARSIHHRPNNVRNGQRQDTE